MHVTGPLIFNKVIFFIKKYMTRPSRIARHGSKLYSGRRLQKSQNVYIIDERVWFSGKTYPSQGWIESSILSTRTIYK